MPSDTPGMERLRLGDGRHVAFARFGAMDGHPVLALHGTPGSRLKFAVADAAAKELGLALIAIDRWGYGATDPHPRPTLEAFVDDMSDLLARLGVDRFAVMGVSGGGPYTAALAARLGARVTAAALVSPVGPIAGKVASRDLAAFHRFAFGAFPRHRWLMAMAFGAFRRALLRSPALAMKVVVARARPVDRLMMGDITVGGRLAHSFRVGLAGGTRGMAIDMAIFAAPWGVDLAAAVAPSRIWIGGQDTSVPLAAVRVLARELPGATVVELPEAGHLWIARHYPEVLGWLAAASQRVGA